MRVERVLLRISDKGLTLNEKKCEFGMNEVTFMGQLLSKHGIDYTESRMKAIIDQRAPKNQAEIRNYLKVMIVVCNS